MDVHGSSDSGYRPLLGKDVSFFKFASRCCFICILSNVSVEAVNYTGSMPYELLRLALTDAGNTYWQSRKGETCVRLLDLQGSHA
jgi:hypothetical protein